MPPSGYIPASIWQPPSVQNLAKDTGAASVAFFQCDPCNEGMVIESTSKPTVGHLHRPRQFNKECRYSGPLPPRCGHKHRSLIAKSGVQRPKASAAYNSRMCQWIADVVAADAMNEATFVELPLSHAPSPLASLSANTTRGPRRTPSLSTPARAAPPRTKRPSTSDRTTTTKARWIAIRAIPVQPPTSTRTASPASSCALTCSRGVRRP